MHKLNICKKKVYFNWNNIFFNFLIFFLYFRAGLGVFRRAPSLNPVFIKYAQVGLSLTQNTPSQVEQAFFIVPDPNSDFKALLPSPLMQLLFFELEN